MTVRRLQLEELDDYLNLCSFAFQFDLSDQERQRAKEEFGQTKVLASFRDEKLVCGLQIIPFETYVNGASMKMGGIAAVASWPEYRRQGYVQSTLVASLEEMRQEGQVVSMLFPFKQSFYRRYGWEIAADSLRYVLSSQNLPRFGNVPGRMRKADGEIELLDKVYQAFARRFNGAVKRNNTRWKRKFAHGRFHTYVYEAPSGQVEGYILYTVKDRELKVNEWVYNSPDSLKAVWNFIANHDSMINKVSWWGPNDKSHLAILPHTPDEIHLSVGHMARIVDIAGFFAQYRSAGQEASMALNVKDEYAPWNEGCWWLERRSDGAVQITKLASGREDAIELDIQDLTAISLGYCSATTLTETGSLAAMPEQIDTLNCFFKPRTNLNTDFF